MLAKANNEIAPLLDSSKEQEIESSMQEQKEVKGEIYSKLMQTKGAKVAILPSIILGLPTIGMFIITGRIITILFENQSDQSNDEIMHHIFIHVMIMIALSVFIGICKFIDSYFWMQCGSELSTMMKKELFTNLMKSDVLFFDVNPIGCLLTLLSEDAQNIQDSFGQIKGAQISNVATLICGIIGTFVYSWKIGLIFTSSFVLIVFVFFFFIPCVSKSMRKKFFFLNNEMTIANESLSSIKTVRSFNGEDKESFMFHQMNQLSQENERNALLIIAILMTIVMTIIWGTIIGNLYYASFLFSDQKDGISIGDLFSIFGFCMNASMALISLTSTSDNEEKAIESGSRMIKLSHYEPQINFEGGSIIDDFKGKIEFRDVSFKYPTRNFFVLRHVSFVINPNQITAFVGHSGSGKSTCIQLIERFYDVTEGSILFDGVDIKSLDPRWIHKQIGLISQEPVLFNASVKENILFGNINASFEQVLEATEIANARKFIEKFDHGFDTFVGEKGSLISGGQKQRIAIARAVIRNPAILIADEATSSLDAENEAKIQIALNKVMKNRTSLIISHHLNTIKNANIIYVFVAGEIKESGNHEQLLHMNGFYSDLIKKQSTNQEKNQNNTSNILNENNNNNEDDSEASISSN